MVNNLSQTINNISGVVYTVNNMLSNVSLTASHASADKLNVNNTSETGTTRKEIFQGWNKKKKI